MFVVGTVLKIFNRALGTCGGKLLCTQSAQSSLDQRTCRTIHKIGNIRNIFKKIK